MKCAICNWEGRMLKSHLKNTHNIGDEQYAVTYLHNSIRPICIICEEPLRWVGFKFGMFKRTCGNQDCRRKDPQYLHNISQAGLRRYTNPEEIRRASLRQSEVIRNFGPTYKPWIIYKGKSYRSNPEIQFVKILEELNIEFIYEPRLKLPDGSTIIPDFQLIGLNCYVEIGMSSQYLERNRATEMRTGFKVLEYSGPEVYKEISRIKNDLKTLIQLI